MYVRVAVYPGSKKESVTEQGPHRYEIKVKEPAERNLANKRVKEILASHYKTTESKVRLVSGHQNSRKIFAVPDEV